MSGYCGSGEAIGHAGELAQGALWRNGRQETFVVTLPAPPLRSRAKASLAGVSQAGFKARQVATAAGREWLGATTSLSLVLQSNIPSGRGGGSSTADCVAALRAVARLAGRSLSAAEIARRVQAVEGATDPTMFGWTPLVFLSRRGEVERYFTGAWPSLHVAVVDLGGAPVPTDKLRLPIFQNSEMEDYGELLDHLAAGFAQADPRQLGAVASRSGDLWQRHFPVARWTELRVAAQRWGAWGVARAHTGTWAAVLAAKPWPGDTVLHYSTGDSQPWP